MYIRGLTFSFFSCFLFRVLNIELNGKAIGTKGAIPAFNDIEKISNLYNPQNITPVKWPIVLRPLCSVPLIVAGARSKASGSPAGLQARLYVAPHADKNNHPDVIDK